MSYIGNQITGEHTKVFREFFISAGLATFTLSEIPRSKENLIVTLNGVQTNNFTLSNNLLTFGVAPSVGVEVNVIHLTSNRAINFNDYNTSTEDALLNALVLG